MRATFLSLLLSKRARALPVAGADFQALEEEDWEVTTSATGGLEFGNVFSGRRLRLLFVYLNGFLPFSQFFNTERVESYGIAAQFEL